MWGWSVLDVLSVIYARTITKFWLTWYPCNQFVHSPWSFFEFWAFSTWIGLLHSIWSVCSQAFNIWMAQSVSVISMTSVQAPLQNWPLIFLSFVHYSVSILFCSMERKICKNTILCKRQLEMMVFRWQKGVGWEYSKDCCIRIILFSLVAPLQSLFYFFQFCNQNPMSTSHGPRICEEVMGESR